MLPFTFFPPFLRLLWSNHVFLLSVLPSFVIVTQAALQHKSKYVLGACCLHLQFPCCCSGEKERILFFDESSNDFLCLRWELNNIFLHFQRETIVLFAQTRESPILASWWNLIDRWVKESRHDWNISPKEDNSSVLDSLQTVQRKLISICLFQWGIYSFWNENNFQLFVAFVWTNERTSIRSWWWSLRCCSGIHERFTSVGRSPALPVVMDREISHAGRKDRYKISLKPMRSCGCSHDR